MRFRLLCGLAAAALTSGGAALGQLPEGPALPPLPPAFEGQTDAPPPAVPSPPIDVQVVVRGLQFPWSMVFLPDGRLMVSERWGSIRLINPHEVPRSRIPALPNLPTAVVSPPILGLPPIKADNHGVGLHGIALDPDFANNRLVYFAYFAPPAGEDPAIWPYWISEQKGDPGGTETVARARLSKDDKRFEDVEVLLTGVDRRLLFGPDGKLYATGIERYRMYNSSGEGLEVADAPLVDRMNFTGRISRINPDGSIPKDNPFLNRPGAPPDLYAFGIRDTLGVAFDPTGQLWEVEFGPWGGDELNLVRPGADLGWAEISYGTRRRGSYVNRGLTAKEGMTQPVYFWNPGVGPSNLLFYTGDMFPAWKGSLLFGAVTARTLIRLEIKNNRVVSEESLLGDRNQRFRDIAQAADGSVYLISDDGDLLRLVPKT